MLNFFKSLKSKKFKICKNTVYKDNKDGFSHFYYSLVNGLNLTFSVHKDSTTIVKTFYSAIYKNDIIIAQEIIKIPIPESTKHDAIIFSVIFKHFSKMIPYYSTYDTSKFDDITKYIDSSDFQSYKKFDIIPLDTYLNFNLFSIVVEPNDNNYDEQYLGSYIFNNLIIYDDLLYESLGSKHSNSETLQHPCFLLKKMNNILKNKLIDLDYGLKFSYKNWNSYISIDRQSFLLNSQIIGNHKNKTVVIDFLFEIFINKHISNIHLKIVNNDNLIDSISIPLLFDIKNDEYYIENIKSILQNKIIKYMPSLKIYSLLQLSEDIYPLPEEYLILIDMIEI